MASSSSSSAPTSAPTNCAVADFKYSELKVSSDSTVLITGGSSGLGLALAKRFAKSGATVIVTGRRQELLDQAAKEVPGLITKKSDAGLESEREELFNWATKTYPKLNIVINNAGIQNRKTLTDTQPWSERAQEIEINFNGPIHLCTLFAPFLAGLKSDAALMNVTSGLAFIPFVAGPVYSATKAGLHNFTMALRWSLEKTKVRVVEIIPPAVKSNLGGSHDHGEDQNEWADHTYARILEGCSEAAFTFSEKGRHASRAEIDQMFTGMAGGMAKQMGVKQFE